MSNKNIFKFKFFEVEQLESVFKVGTDSLVLGSWINGDYQPKHILDIGSGTGVLSLMMAQKFSDTYILAIDTNPDALALSQANFSRNNKGLQCKVQMIDFFDFDDTQKFDLLVSNPPYFLDSSIPKTGVLELAKHLSSKDLIAFFIKASNLLSSSGKLYMIFPNDQRFVTTAREAGLFAQRILEVFGKPNVLKRLCVQFGFQEIALIRERLTIRDEQGRYTQEYRDLTRDFHGVELR